ncbi:MAG: helix-turn-helix domain-containing protein [Prevotella sp.]|jgi:DNA-binding Xre family transcriptional regulator|nr:helix-turn-helix domain-containing protein [Prevotella sp.]
MMANLLKIKEIAKEKKVSIKELSASAGITEQGLQKLIRENSTKVDTLEAIAKKLNVPISVFFSEVPVVECKQSTEDRLLSIIESQQRTIENLTNK